MEFHLFWDMNMTECQAKDELSPGCGRGGPDPRQMLDFSVNRKHSSYISGKVIYQIFRSSQAIFVSLYFINNMKLINILLS